MLEDFRQYDRILPMNRHKHLTPGLEYVPKRCMVGETAKIIYATREEAEVAAKVAEYDHGVKLGVYKCEYGDHWHLASIE